MTTFQNTFPTDFLVLTIKVIILVEILTKTIVINEILVYWPLFLCAMIGGLFGNYLNIKIFNSRILALVTSILVIFVAIRMASRILF